MILFLTIWLNYIAPQIYSSKRYLKSSKNQTKVVFFNIYNYKSVKFLSVSKGQAKKINIS